MSIAFYMSHLFFNAFKTSLKKNPLLLRVSVFLASFFNLAQTSTTHNPFAF